MKVKTHFTKYKCKLVQPLSVEAEEVEPTSVAYLLVPHHERLDVGIVPLNLLGRVLLSPVF